MWRSIGIAVLFWGVASCSSSPSEQIKIQKLSTCNEVCPVKINLSGRSAPYGVGTMFLGLGYDKGVLTEASNSYNLLHSIGVWGTENNYHFFVYSDIGVDKKSQNLVLYITFTKEDMVAKYGEHLFGVEDALKGEIQKYRNEMQ